MNCQLQFASIYALSNLAPCYLLAIPLLPPTFSLPKKGFFASFLHNDSFFVCILLQNVISPASCTKADILLQNITKTSARQSFFISLPKRRVPHGAASSNTILRCQKTGLFMPTGIRGTDAQKSAPDANIATFTVRTRCTAATSRAANAERRATSICL